MNATTVETVTDPAQAAEVAAVAAQTFPLACPPHSTPDDIAAHIEQHLSSKRFAEYIADDTHDVLVAHDPTGQIVGYALIVIGRPTDPDVVSALRGDVDGAAALEAGAVGEVSKMYVLPDHHASRGGGRPAHALMAAALASARDHGCAYVWLGVNDENARAQKYYRKMGFTRIGTKTFDMNGVTEHDYVMGQRLA